MLEAIHYKSSDDKWKIFPGWAQWMVNAGLLIGTSEKDRSRLVLGLSLPVKNFASTFIAAGVIYKRAECPTENYDDVEYFEFLKSFPASTGVSILMETGGVLRRRPGKIESVYNDGTKEYIAILYVENEKKKLWCKRCFYIEHCRRITITEENIDITSSKKRGKAVVNNFQFLSQFIPDPCLSDFTTGSRMDCFIVSSRQRLMSEMEQPFGIRKNGADFISGNFSDIIRPKNRYEFGQSYRSIIYSANSKKQPDNSINNPWCVIFDSAAAYLKWHDHFGLSHQVVILDRTDKYHHNAAQHLNDRYYQRVDTSDSTVSESPIPPGIEIMSFREKCHA